MTDNADAIFTWDYEKGARPALNKLYEKAKTSQWNGETDLTWTIEVDVEKVVGATCRWTGENDPVLRGHRPRRRAAPELGREGVDRDADRGPELDAEPVHARRAGRAAVHRQDRRDGAVDRRQVLRRRPR